MKLWERSKPYLLDELIGMGGGGGAGIIDPSGLPAASPIDPSLLPPLFGLPPYGTVPVSSLPGQNYPSTTPSPPSIYGGGTTGAGPMGPSGPTMGGDVGGAPLGGRTLPPLQTPVPPPPDVSSLPPVSTPAAGSPRSLPPLPGIGLPTSTASGFLTTLLNNLGKFATAQNQAKQQRGGGGGGGYEPVHGGGGLLLPPAALPLSTLPYGGLPTPQALQMPVLGKFQFGGTAPASGLYQVDQGETVRTPEQEQQLQQTIAANYGLAPAAGAPAAPSTAGVGGLGGRAASAGQTLEDTALTSGAPPGGMASPAQIGQMLPTMQPPQFGDPSAFPKIPGIPETGVTAQQAAGPGFPTQGPFQQMPMPGSFLDKGARTAWTIRDALNNVSQAAGRYQQMQWDKRMTTATSQAMNEIQKQMKAQQGRQPGQIAGQQQQQPDEVTQAIQAALQTTKDPKERDKLQKMLQQRAKGQEREAANWAKTLMKAQDPTTPEYIGVQRAYGMMRGMGEQALNDALLQERANSARMVAQAEYMDAIVKQQQAQAQQQWAKNFEGEIGKITGNVPPQQPTGESGKNVQDSKAAAGSTPSADPIDQMIADRPFDNNEKAIVLAGFKQSAQSGDGGKAATEAIDKVAVQRYTEGKHDPSMDTIDWDDNSPTHWSKAPRNHLGESMIDKRTGKPMLIPGAPAPRGTETATLHYYHWTDANGKVQETSFYNVNNIPIGPDGKLRVGPTGAPAIRGGVPSHTSAPATGSRQVSKGGPGPSATPTHERPPGTIPRPEETASALPPGTRTLGQGKEQKMQGGTLPGGADIFGTRAELEAAGVPPESIHELDAKDIGMVNPARSMLQPIARDTPPPQQAPKGFVPRGGLYNQALYVLDQFKPGEMGFLQARWNELVTGEGGPADPRFVALRTLVHGLISTALIQAHGAGKGQWIVSDFQNLANTGKMNQDTLRQALETEKVYIESRAGNPTMEVTDGKDGFYDVPFNELMGYLKTHKDQWVVQQ